MARQRSVESLSADELRQLLIKKRRSERQARLENYRHTGRVIDLEPEMGLARIGRRGRASQFETEAELVRSREIFLNLRKPYLVRIDGQGRPSDIRDAILLAFGHAALERIAAAPGLSARERLNASLAVHGAKLLGPAD